MRRFFACLCASVCTAILTISLVACGGNSSGSSKPKSGSLNDTEPVTIDFKGWKLEFETPKVSWSEYEESDLFTIKAKVTNNTGKAAKFEDVNNVNAITSDSNQLLEICDMDELMLRKQAIESSIDTSVDKEKKTSDDNESNNNASASIDDALDDLAADGTIFQNVDEAKQVTENGGTINLTYSWKLNGNYETIRVLIQGFSPSGDDTEMTYKDVQPTAEFAQYQTLKEIEKDAKRSTTEATIKGATVSKPNNWYLDGFLRSSVNVKQVADSTNKVGVQFITTSEKARDRALKYAANYKLNESDVETVVINGVEWYVFRPTMASFQAYTDSTDGIVNVGSDVVRWEDAEPVLNAITIH